MTKATKFAIPQKLPESLRPSLEARWAAFQESAAHAAVPVPMQADFQAVISRVWACSDFVAQSCIREPELLRDLLSSGDLLGDYRADEFEEKLSGLVAGVSTDQALGQVLRRFRRREMVRIAFRDLAGWAPVDEVLRDLSELADACIRMALDCLYRWHCQVHGKPKDSQGKAQPLLVLGMGKLGAHELNYSSDIDLIFVYPQAGSVRKRVSLSLEEFFTQLGRRLIVVLDDNTADGFVFRVDMRLRPFGDAGPLVMDFDMLEDYYQTQGREWERYAMIKARAITGSPDAIHELEQLLRPFIYRRYLDFGTFEQLREMKGMIMREVERRGLQHNVKLGPGGIREVEFIAQAFQLIRGGREAALRSRSLLQVLNELVALDLMPAYAAERLSVAYRYLRRVENRLQEFDDEQTHVLPGDEQGRARLAFSMGCEDWDSFIEQLDEHRQFVHEQFQQVFGTPQTEQDDSDENGLAVLWLGEPTDEEAVERFAREGFDDPAEAWRLLVQTRQAIASRLGKRGRERLDKLMPLLLGAVGDTSAPTVTLSRILHLVEAIAGRSAYLALLVEHPMGLSQLARLCDASPWIATQLTQHPVLLDELLDPRTLYNPPARKQLEQQLAHRLSDIQEDDLEQQMEVLRHFKQSAVLRVAAADVMGATPLMSVSDKLTDIAEVVLARVLALGWEYMIKRHGKPLCSDKGKTRVPGFAVIGYGKLGGIELGYGSDLDLVFLHDSRGEGRSDGAKPLDNAVYFARLGQRVIHLLNTLTPSGILYEVDMRLRPSGASGLLVSSLEAFLQYQQQEAWTWEHQALVRARPVAGDQALAEEFSKVRQSILQRSRDPAALKKEVRDMRERMRTELGNKKAGYFNLKQDVGGIADIEFMVQYCILRYAHDYPDLVEFSDNMRLLDGLARHDLLSAGEAEALGDAYRAFRKRGHQLALQDVDAVVEDWEFVNARETVSAAWSRLMLD